MELYYHGTHKETTHDNRRETLSLLSDTFPCFKEGSPSRKRQILFPQLLSQARGITEIKTWPYHQVRLVRKKSATDLPAKWQIPKAACFFAVKHTITKHNSLDSWHTSCVQAGAKRPNPKHTEKLPSATNSRFVIDADMTNTPQYYKYTTKIVTVPTTCQTT